MANEEYLPPANETALVIPEETAVTAPPDLIRIQCSMCSHENGMTGRRDHALSLLERLGWKIGAKILCPDCVRKTARKFFERYRE